MTVDNVPVGRGRAAATASLRPPTIDPEVVEDALLKKLTLPPDPDTDFPLTTAQTQAELAEFYPPQTKLSGKFPGKLGKKCSLQTNYFPISLKLPQGVIYQYDVVISPPWASKRGYKRADKALYHMVIKEWKRLHPVASKSPYAWVFDGHKQLFCTQMFKPEEMVDISVEVWCDREEKMLKVQVKDIQISGCIKVNKDLTDWSESGRSGAMPQDALQALNIVLKESVNLDPHIFNIGRYS